MLFGQVLDYFLEIRMVILKQISYLFIVWVLCVIFGFVQGVFNTLGTVVGEISNEYGYSAVRYYL